MATAIYHVARYPTSASATLFADGTATVRCARPPTWDRAPTPRPPRSRRTRSACQSNACDSSLATRPASSRQGTRRLDHDGQCRIGGAGRLRGIEVKALRARLPIRATRTTLESLLRRRWLANASMPMPPPRRATRRRPTALSASAQCSPRCASIRICAPYASRG